MTTRDAEVEGASTEVEHEGETGRDIGRASSSDGLFDEPDLLQPGQARGLLKPGPCALFDHWAAHEFDRPADGRRRRSRPGELLHPFEDPRQDHRDEVFEAALVPEYIRLGQG